MTRVPATIMIFVTIAATMLYSAGTRPAGAADMSGLRQDRCEDWRTLKDFTGRELDTDLLTSYRMIARVVRTAPPLLEILRSERDRYPKRARWPRPWSVDSLLNRYYLAPLATPAAAEIFPELRFNDIVELKAYTQVGCRIKDNPPLIYSVVKTDTPYGDISPQVTLLRYGTPDNGLLRIYADGSAEYQIGDQSPHILKDQHLTPEEFGRLTELLDSPGADRIRAVTEDPGSETPDTGYLILARDRLYISALPGGDPSWKGLRALLESVKKRLRRPLAVTLTHLGRREANMINWDPKDVSFEQFLEWKRTAREVMARYGPGEEYSEADSQLLEPLRKEASYPFRRVLEVSSSRDIMVAYNDKLYAVSKNHQHPAGAKFGWWSYMVLDVYEITENPNASAWRLWPLDAGIRLRDVPPKTGLPIPHELMQEHFDFYDTIRGPTKFVEEGMIYERVDLRRSLR